MRINYKVAMIDGVYYFPDWIETELYQKEWPYNQSGAMADERNFHMSRISKKSDDMRHAIQEGLEYGDEFMVVRCRYEILYRGIPDYNSAEKATLEYFKEMQKQCDITDRLFHLQPEFKNYIVRYLEAALALAKEDNDMQDIVCQRERLRGEEDEIKLCIEGIKQLL